METVNEDGNEAAHNPDIPAPKVQEAEPMEAPVEFQECAEQRNGALYPDAQMFLQEDMYQVQSDMKKQTSFQRNVQAIVLA